MHSPPNFLLLADWSELIGILVVLGFGVLRYLLSEVGQAKKPAKPPPRRPAPQRGGQQQPAGGGQGELRSEIDDFLRRAKGMPEREPELELVPELETVEPTPKTVQRRPTLAAQPLEPVPVSQSVADHVSSHLRHLEESQLAENAAKLGQEVALADDKVRARLDAKFKHQLGKLDRGQQPPAEVPPVDKQVLAADQIAAMLANPEGVRNAIILNEILQRPTDRW